MSTKVLNDFVIPWFYTNRPENDLLNKEGMRKRGLDKVLSVHAVTEDKVLHTSFNNNQPSAIPLF